MRSSGTVRTIAPGEGGGSEGGGDGDSGMGGGGSGGGDRGSEGDGRDGSTSFEILGGHEATAMQRALGGRANTARAPTVRSQPLHRVVRPSLHVTAAEEW